MDIQVRQQAFAEIDAPWLVLFVFEQQTQPPVDLGDAPLGGLLTRLIIQKEVSGSPGDLTVLHGPLGKPESSLLIAGLGEQEEVGPGDVYTAGYAIAKRLFRKQRDQLSILLPDLLIRQADRLLSSLIEGIVAGCQSPGIRKGERNRYFFETLTLVLPPGTSEEFERRVEKQAFRGASVGLAINVARHFVNLPPAEKTPTKLAGMVADLAAGDGSFTAQVWDESRIREERFGGLLGVAAGSDEPPAFAILEYKGGGNGPTLALVGKGVTFDSGGLSLKPSSSMEDMKSDMTGAAVIAAAVQAIAVLGVPINVRAYLAFTENMTGGRAMKLGDVLTMRNGKTVEVLNTDAEGRLILADALCLAAESKPEAIIDLATLTGACMVALGTKIAGLFTNDDAIGEQIRAAAKRAGERVWRLPLDDDFKDALKSQVADFKNVGGKWGGAITAAKFLEQFVGQTTWAHLDVAGPSWNDTETSSRDAGGTGCFVRTLVAFAEDLAKRQD